MSSFSDIYYTAALIEFVGRNTCNHRADIVKAIGKKGLERLVQTACVNHCLPFEQVSDELKEQYEIQNGSYDTVSSCKFQVPSHLAIGKVYARLVEDLCKSPDAYVDMLYEVFTSKVTDAISNFNSSFYFAPRAEIAFYYREEYAH